MDSSEILAQIEAEIERLKKAKALLAGSSKKLTTSRQGKALHVGTETERKAGPHAVHAAQKRRWAKAKRSGTGDGGYDVKAGK